MQTSRKQSKGASYMGLGSHPTQGTTRFRAALKSLLSGALAVLFLIVTITSVFVNSSKTAFADENDAKDKINKAADSYIVKKDNPEDSFYSTMDKFDKEGGATRETNTFASVIQRILTTSYMNETSTGSAAGGAPNGINGSGKNCDVNIATAGTPLYHNCDVPNLGTELFQDLLGFIARTGPQYAEVENATLDAAWFGLPSNLPGGGAPVDPSARTVKYTALETFGYNMKFTNYLGEWDHVKVMTAARALSNFGFMDNLTMSVTAIANGIAGGIDRAATNFSNSISNGDVLGAIGGMFTGFFEGATSATLNSILDTSDLNVFNTYAWYRIGYGGTLYQARELTSTEVAANAKSQLINMLSNSSPDKSKVPDDLQSIQGGPPAPKEAIAQCTFVNSSGSNEAWGNTSIAPGPTEDECKTAAKAAYDTRQAGSNPPANDNADYVWSKDGTQKAETLAAWKEANKTLFDAAEKYGISCTLDTDENNRATNLATFNACWPDAWDKAAEKAQKSSQTESNDKWIKEQLTEAKLREWVQADPSRNFNAPWNRFVCTDAKGKDIKDGPNPVMLYDHNGNLNPKCQATRPPIQDGFFGNGYVNGQEKPELDTRYGLVDKSIFSSLIPMSSITTSLASMGLGVSIFFTRVSNTVINLSFSPVFETLGLDNLVVKLIGGFRDSVFFPLVAFAVAIAGLMALWSAGKNKDYKRQAVSLLLMTGTIMTGVFLMYRPEQTLKMIDGVPAQVEAAVIGSIYSVGNSESDEVCTASGTVATDKNVGLDGRTLDYGPHESTRRLMCENWRVFAFNSWVHGQWGTNFDHLYASNTNYPNRMNNTNGSLVGDASINMGGGVTVKNWALYQLQTTSSGTASHPDPSRPSGNIDRNFYRLVDLQAGPNGGAGTDGRYLNTWAGKDMGARMQVGMLSPLVSGLGMVTVLAYTITKIQIVFVTLIMLLILPLMFLIGIHPTQGRMKLKGYVGTIIGLIIQRIVLVLVMAVMFRVLVGFGNASTNYLLNSLMLVVTCLIFLRLKKPILTMIFDGISAKMGAPVGGQFVSDPDGWRRKHTLERGGLISNALARTGTTVSGLATGAIGGYLSGGVKGMAAGAKESAKYELASLRNKQRRRGFHIAETALKAAKQGKEDTQKKLREHDDFKATSNEVLKGTKAYQDYERELEAWHKLEDADVDGRKIKIDAEGREVMKPKAPSMKSGSMSRTTRRIAKATELQQSLDEKKAKFESETYAESSNLERAAQRINDFHEDRNAVMEHIDEARETSSESETPRQTRQRKRIQAQQERLDKKMAHLSKTEDRFHQRDMMVEQLNGLFARARASEKQAKERIEDRGGKSDDN